RILVHNKIDRCGRAPEVGLDRYGRIDRVWASAVTGEGLELLRSAIDQQVTVWQQARRRSESRDARGDALDPAAGAVAPDEAHAQRAARIHLLLARVPDHVVARPLDLLAQRPRLGP